MRLRSRLRQFRRRLWMIGSASAMAWGVAAAVLLLLVAAWLDLLWELSPRARLGITAVAIVAGLAALGGCIAATLRAAGQRRIAGRVDRAGNLGGQVLTGLELERRGADIAGDPRSSLSAGLACLAVDRATAAAGAVPAAEAIPARPLRRAGTVLLSLAGVVALLAVCLPGLARTQLDRFLHPGADVPPFSPLVLRVEPGDARVLYGNPLEVHAELSGGAADQVELVLTRPDDDEQVLPMFPETDGRWRTVVAAVTEAGTYHVRAHRARSPRYRIDVVTVPRIEEVRVRVEPPAYTGQEAYEGPVPKDGIAALPGAEARVWVRSNRPLSGGTLAVELDAPDADPCETAMQPEAPGAHEVVGQFAVSGDGKLVARVVDEAGQPSRETFTATITRLKDQRPLIRILKPPVQSLATPDATLPVTLSAEDDYGISRVQLFRSLNDSRSLPTDTPLDAPPPRRAEPRVDLPLAAYGLRPGDTIKLFGRVEDNDPAGAKGAESTVATVRIISQEEFERLVRMREGLDALLSKYREARRRMEGIQDELEQLLEACREEPADAPVGEDTRREIERLRKRLREESEALGRLARHSIPLDMDRALADELEALAEWTEQMAEQLETLDDDTELNHGALTGQMEKLLKELSDRRGHFQNMVMVPLEALEAFFPLMVDQSRFVKLVLRQMDLAERLGAIRGRDAEDDPALRARMRELEEEQRTIRETLDEVLGDIERHAEELPDDERLDELRFAAKTFVAQVRDSGASGAMAEAENALAEFSCSRGYEQARLAAELLREFLSIADEDCLGAMTHAAMLAYQPGLGGMLGDTIPQLLSAMGLGMGSGWGMGSGGMGGFSAMRGGTRNMGLYGMLPGMGETYSAGTSAQVRSPGGESGGGPGDLTQEGVNPEQPGWDGPAAPGEATGMSEAAVPPRYRRRVGEYFQRLAEELSRP